MTQSATLLLRLRKGAAFFSAALVMLVAFGWFFLARVQAQTPVPAPFTIQGQLFNGTRDAPANSLANVPVVIFQVGAKGPIEKTVLTDAQGKFLLTDVITDANAYFARAQYGGIKYFSEIVPARIAAANPLTVTVYETQTVPADFTIERAHFILDVQPKSLSGLEFVQVSNPGDRVFLVPLPLPEKYDEVHFDDTRDEGRAQRLADGTILFPVMPTTSEILFNVTLPYAPPDYQLRVPFTYPVNGINLLLSKYGDVSASGSQLAPGQTFTSQNGQQYLIYSAPKQPAGTTFAATISNLPGYDNTQNLQTLILIAGGLGGLALLAYPVYRRYARDKKSVIKTDRATMVQAIARLDDAYARDEIDEQAYADERAALKAELLKKDVGTLER